MFRKYFGQGSCRVWKTFSEESVQEQNPMRCLLRDRFVGCSFVHCWTSKSQWVGRSSGHCNRLETMCCAGVTLQVIQGLVKPEDMPKDTGAAANGHDADAGDDGAAETGRVDGPAISTPPASPVDPRAKARADAGCFAALRALPRADKEKLFAAAVARTVKGQLAFEHDARPELEATVARLDIDFAKHVRPTADSFWSRIRKSRILDIARETLGAAWASTRSKYKKADLAKSMEEAFAAGTPPVGIGATMHAAALAWTIPGFAAFDTGGADEEEAAATEATADAPGNTADASGDATADAAPAEAKSPNGDGESVPAPEAGEPAAEPDTGANGNGHADPVEDEAEAGPEPVNGEGSEEGQHEPSVADAIDAVNAVPTADGGPRVIVQQVGPVNGSDAGDDPLEIPEFLRRVH